jgi:F0F1-type ATP synthase assembly protein I
VFNSLADNRRLAYRLVAVQAAVAVLVAAGFGLRDAPSALSAGLGGGAVALGSAALAWRSLFGPAMSAGTALARMVSGLLIKWFVVLGTAYVVLARLGLPPLPLLAGMAATMFASFLTQGFQARVSSER